MTALSHTLGFSSSWRMLTRDRGWVKPLLMLTLLGWVPVLGQIALLGYALEWARLTAWGVDAAPKQHGVAYGKVLSTGARAFLVALSMAVVVSVIDWFLFGGIFSFAAFPALTNLAGGALDSFSGGMFIVRYALMLVINLFMGTFIAAAMMRATIYDSFAAGWRLDRIFQMVGRDLGGFLKTYLVSFIAGFVNWAISTLISVACATVLIAGVLGAMGMAAVSGFSEEEVVDAVIHGLVQVGPAPLVAIVLVGVALFFLEGLVGVAMQLVSLNAMGQWFRRFDVGRWGTSSDPLPVDVPVREAGTVGQVPTAAAGSVDAGVVQPAARQQAQAVQPQTEPSPATAEAVSEPSAPDAAVPVSAPAEPEPQVDPVPQPSPSAESSMPEPESEASGTEVPKPHTPAPWDEVLGEDADIPDLTKPAPVEPTPAPEDAAPASVDGVDEGKLD